MATDTILCWRHPGHAHPSIHEAAHALAGIQRGIAFRRATVVPLDQPEFDKGIRVLGRIEDDGEPRVWVQADPIGAAEYVLAGFVAECELLGHHLPGSFDSDIAAWRIGAGFRGYRQVPEMEEFMGMTFNDVLDRLEVWLVEYGATIRSIAEQLSTSLTLSAAEIGALVDAQHHQAPQLG